MLPSSSTRIGNWLLLLLLLGGRRVAAAPRPRLANGVYNLVDHPNGGYRGTSAVDGRVVRYGVILSNAIPKAPGSDQDDKWKRVILEFNDPRATGKMRNSVTPDSSAIGGRHRVQLDLYGTGFAWASDEGWRQPGEYHYTPIGVATLNITYTNGVLEWHTSEDDYADVMFNLNRNPKAAGSGTITIDYEDNGGGSSYVFDWKAKANHWGLLLMAGDWLNGNGYGYQENDPEQVAYWEQYKGDFTGEGGGDDHVGSIVGWGQDLQPTDIIVVLERMPPPDEESDEE